MAEQLAVDQLFQMLGQQATTPMAVAKEYVASKPEPEALICAAMKMALERDDQYIWSSLAVLGSFWPSACLVEPISLALERYDSTQISVEDTLELAGDVKSEQLLPVLEQCITIFPKDATERSISKKAIWSIIATRCPEAKRILDWAAGSPDPEVSRLAKRLLGSWDDWSGEHTTPDSLETARMREDMRLGRDRGKRLQVWSSDD